MMPFCSAARIGRFSHGSVCDFSYPRKVAGWKFAKEHGWWRSHVAYDSHVADDSHVAGDSLVADDTHIANDSHVANDILVAADSHVANDSIAESEKKEREREQANKSHLICRIRGWDSCHESCAADGDAVHVVADSFLSSTISSLPTFRAPVHEA